jgi:hypothetical protein
VGRAPCSLPILRDAALRAVPQAEDFVLLNDSISPGKTPEGIAAMEAVRSGSSGETRLERGARCTVALQQGRGPAAVAIDIGDAAGIGAQPVTKELAVTTETMCRDAP